MAPPCWKKAIDLGALGASGTAPEMAGFEEEAQSALRMALPFTDIGHMRYLRSFMGGRGAHVCHRCRC